MSITTATPRITLRKPTLDDGEVLWRLIQKSPPLDVNSRYAYLLLCHHYRETCIVAELDGEIVGFVSAYLPPEKDDVVFVWQVAVRPAVRGYGVAGAMLAELIQRPACEDITYLETTVEPTNTASQALFKSFAGKLDTQYDTKTLFTEDLFGSDDHEEERLYRIGPITRNKIISEEPLWESH